MALSHSPKIVTDGLVLCLDAGDRKSYPGSGTTWTDRSGNSYNGALTNGPTFDSANGGSIVLDGSNQYIDIGGASNATNSKVTVTFWYNPTTIQNSAYNGIFNGLTPGGSFCLFWLSTDDVAVQYRDDSGLERANGGVWTLSLSPTSISTAGEWYFIQITGDEDTNEWRVGVDLNSSTSSSGSQFALTNESKWLVGRRGNNLYDHSQFSNLQVYNRILSQTEIEQNFQATRGRFGV